MTNKASPMFDLLNSPVNVSEAACMHNFKAVFQTPGTLCSVIKVTFGNKSILKQFGLI